MRRIFGMYWIAVKIVGEVFFLWSFTMCLVVLLNVLDKIRAYSLGDRVCDWMEEKFIPHLDRRKEELVNGVNSKLTRTDV